MTTEEITILIIMYILAIIIVIQSSRLWLLQRYVRHLKKQNPNITIATAPIKPIIFDQNRSVPKATDAKMPISEPRTKAAPIVDTNLAIVRQFYQRVKHIINHNRQEPL